MSTITCDGISKSVETNPPPKPVAFFDHRKEPDCTMEYQVYDKQEADAYIHWLEQKAGVLLAKLEGQDARIKEMEEAAADIGLKWKDYDAGEDAWEDQHKGKWQNIACDSDKKSYGGMETDGQSS